MFHSQYSTVTQRERERDCGPARCCYERIACRMVDRVRCVADRIFLSRRTRHRTPANRIEGARVAGGYIESLTLQGHLQEGVVEGLQHPGFARSFGRDV